MARRRRVKRNAFTAVHMMYGRARADTAQKEPTRGVIRQKSRNAVDISLTIHLRRTSSRFIASRTSESTWKTRLPHSVAAASSASVVHCILTRLQYASQHQTVHHPAQWSTHGRADRAASGCQIFKRNSSASQVLLSDPRFPGEDFVLLTP